MAKLELGSHDSVFRSPVTAVSDRLQQLLSEPLPDELRAFWQAVSAATRSSGELPAHLNLDKFDDLVGKLDDQERARLSLLVATIRQCLEDPSILVKVNAPSKHVDAMLAAREALREQEVWRKRSNPRNLASCWNGSNTTTKPFGSWRPRT